MNNQLLNLITVQFKAFLREPAIIFWSIIFPLAIAGVLGIAFNQPDEPVRTVAVVKNEHVDASKNLKRLRLLAQDSPTTSDARFAFFPTTKDSAQIKMKRGEINLFIEVGPKDSLFFNFDPKNAEGRLAYLLLDNKLLKGERQTELTVVRPVTTIGSRYIDFLIPGLIALGIMNSCIWGIGWNLIEFRIKKLMRRMIATPMKRTYFLLAQILSRAVLCSIEAALLFLFAYLVFGVTMQGSLLAFVLVFLSGIMAFAGVAVIASSRVSNNQEGNGVINAVVLPMTILSGIFFSYRGFPDWAVVIIEKLPLTMLSDAIRAIFNEGATLQDVGAQIIGLISIGFVLFVAGLRIYKWY